MIERINDDERKNVKKSDFEFYRNFHNVEEAKAFVQLLDANNILFLSETTDTQIDRAIVGHGLVPKVIVKIMPKDFKKINSILASQIDALNPEELKEHYLNLLDIYELKEIIEKPDEWSIEDVSVAKRILELRGVSISSEEVKQIREERFQKARIGKRGNRYWMALYFISIIVGLYMSLFFTVAGLGMGYYYAYDKSTDQDGNRFYTFDQGTRKIGKVFLFAGIAVVIAQLIIIKIISG